MVRAILGFVVIRARPDLTLYLGSLNLQQQPSSVMAHVLIDHDLTASVISDILAYIFRNSVPYT